MKKKIDDQNDLEIIELDDMELDDMDFDDIASDNIDFTEDEDDYEDDYRESNSIKGIPHSMIHILFFVVLIGIIAALVIKISNWGVFIAPEDLAALEGREPDNTLTSILPAPSDTGNTLHEDGVTTILAFGNAPLTDEMDTENGLANLIAEKADATVYNCGISTSRLSAYNYAFSPSEVPADAYSFYWLVSLAVTGKNATQFSEAAAVLGPDTPPEAEKVYETLTTIDLNTVDVVLIMYDGTDYLRGRPMYSDDNPTDTTTFTGNMEAGIEMLQQNYPHIRIIVMSPPYAYAVDESGNYVSSDMYTYGKQDVLSTYVIKQSDSAFMRGVSFVDNLYGSITEDNADEYLIDNIHLNEKGRELLADRFIYALNYYEDMD